MVHPYHGILRERERIIDTGYNLDEAQENYGEWKKSQLPKTVYYMIPFMKHS